MSVSCSSDAIRNSAAWVSSTKIFPPSRARTHRRGRAKGLNARCGQMFPPLRALTYRNLRTENACRACFLGLFWVTRYATREEGLHVGNFSAVRTPGGNQGPRQDSGGAGEEYRPPRIPVSQPGYYPLRTFLLEPGMPILPCDLQTPRR